MTRGVVPKQTLSECGFGTTPHTISTASRSCCPPNLGGQLLLIFNSDIYRMRSRAFAFARDRGDSIGFGGGIAVSGALAVTAGSFGFVPPRREGNRSFGI